MTNNGSSINKELDSRLNEFFDDDTSHEPAKHEDPLENLKAIVLEMEWELGDKSLDAYLSELKKLGAQCRQDKALSIYIKLLDTIGRYLKSKKAAAHPETVSFLKSLFDNFERAVNSGMGEAEKNHSAAVHVQKFKKFKVSISEYAPTKASKPAAPTQPSGQGGLSDEVKTCIRQVVREEIARLIKRK
ncbi:hypothetical protein [Desulfoluna sp.]|uniref:hypothetical protein n=1 Tax=Desulfoluna sp. TaxID=2045199 RepID=UPI002608133D|nr:hypothetical protein [Desulfoluna sp.]